MLTRRDFLKQTSGSIAYAATLSGLCSFADDSLPLNVLLFTADDLHRGSVGAFDGKPEGLTPNLDRFAAEGVCFQRAHVNAAICQPSRAILGTGLYGHNSGAMGFMNAREEVPTVIELFKNEGYLTGVLGKVGHSTPNNRAQWDFVFDQGELGNGRNPDIYYERCRDFFNRCNEEKKPFYFMVNSHDPHRPYQEPERLSKGAKEPSRMYTAEEAAVPGFVADLPKVREEVSCYQNSARRLDDTFGRTMQALRESGREGNTLVMFLSDNGIALPFAKCNVYLASTRTPWMARWPGHIAPGTVDTEHFISGVDYLPTILEAAGIQVPERRDGFSFLPLLAGKAQTGRDRVFTQIDSKAGGESVPMRCVQDSNYGYIFNAWSDGVWWYRNNNEGMTMLAMEKAAETDAAMAVRVKTYRYRTVEELYDLAHDPDCLVNLVDMPEHRKVLDQMRTTLKHWMQETGDPLLPAYEQRDDVEARRKILEAVYGPRQNISIRKKNKKK